VAIATTLRRGDRGDGTVRGDRDGRMIEKRWRIDQH
jgi:hypothetical protein